MGAFRRWLLEGYIKEIDGPFEREKDIHRHPCAADASGSAADLSSSRRRHMRRFGLRSFHFL
jgi:hypothetical protein